MNLSIVLSNLSIANDLLRRGHPCLKKAGQRSSRLLREFCALTVGSLLDSFDQALSLFRLVEDRKQLCLKLFGSFFHGLVIAPEGLRNTSQVTR